MGDRHANRSNESNQKDTQQRAVEMEPPALPHIQNTSPHELVLVAKTLQVEEKLLSIKNGRNTLLIWFEGKNSLHQLTYVSSVQLKLN